MVHKPLIHNISAVSWLLPWQSAYGYGKSIFFRGKTIIVPSVSQHFSPLIHPLGKPARSKASFLFLDEATSALDNNSEKMIQQTIDSISRLADQILLRCLGCRGSKRHFSPSFFGDRTGNPQKNPGGSVQPFFGVRFG